MKFLFEFLFLKFLLYLVFFSPKLLIPIYGKSLGLFLHLTRIRRKVVLSNLKIAFGNEKSDKEINQLCKAFWLHIGQASFETFYMKYIKPEKIQDFVEIEGLDILQNAYDKGLGVTLTGAHYSSFEFVAATISSVFKPIFAYSGLQKNGLVDKEINSIRGKFGTKLISKSRKSAYYMMKALKDGEILGIIGDLNVPKKDLFVDFFGKKASIGKGLSVFSLKRNCPLLFVWVHRYAALKFKLKIIEIPYQLTEDTDKNLQMISQLYTDQVEKIIREDPTQYFWFNRRWKTRPLDEKEQDVYT